MSNKIENIFKTLVDEKIISIENIHGCTQKEISIIEDEFSTTLPSEYRDFLSIAGKGAGKLFQGTVMYYPDILGLRQDAEDLLAETNISHVLPKDACVFRMHQGYEFTFFLPQKNDPEVFQYIEGNDFIDNPWKSFSEFIEHSIDQHIKVWPNLNN